MNDEKPLIVLVDDNITNLKIGKSALSERYTVATAPSAEKLFVLLEGIQPVLILLDIDMPITDGYEALKILKANQKFKDIPVIFLTGLADSHNKEEGFNLGAVDYITKPFEPQALIASIEKHSLEKIGGNES